MSTTEKRHRNQSTERSFCSILIVRKLIYKVFKPYRVVRWCGDYGGKQKKWFPSNYVEEIKNFRVSDVSSQDDTVRFRSSLLCFLLQYEPIVT